jgi:hypothetical protein
VRKILYGLGATTLVVVIAGGTGIGALMRYGRALDAESQAFIDTAVPAITTHWDKQAFLERAMPAMRAGFTSGGGAAIFESYTQLGPLVEYQKAVGQAHMAYIFGQGGQVSATYDAAEKFENGEATLHLVLSKRDGAWLIRNFSVDSRANPTPDQSKTAGERDRGTVVVD